MLPSALCPCANVRRTCRMVMEEQEKNPLVSIQQESLDSLAKQISQNIKEQQQQSNNNDTTTTTPTTTPVLAEWDEEGWHYRGQGFRGDETERQERIALYILALDAINFCFWPSEKDDNAQNSLEYDHLAMALTQLAKQDHHHHESNNNNDTYFFSPTKLAQLEPKQMEQALAPHLQGHYLPNVEERCRLWNELGSSLLETYQGKALGLIQACQSWAPRLVWLVARDFAGFRDETMTIADQRNARQVFFYKRAQIVVGDLNAALELELEGMDRLTTFADYRVPQVLRHEGVLLYHHQELADQVDNRTELGLDQEVAIRAATVVAVDELASRVGLTAVQLDWHLWQVGEQMNQKNEMKPHHRVRTIFY